MMSVPTRLPATEPNPLIPQVSLSLSLAPPPPLSGKLQGYRDAQCKELKPLPNGQAIEDLGHADGRRVSLEVTPPAPVEASACAARTTIDPEPDPLGQAAPRLPTLRNHARQHVYRIRGAVCGQSFP